jgi:hypothetical protein
MCCLLHFSRVARETTPDVLQLNEPVKFTTSFVWLDFVSLVVETLGQVLPSPVFSLAKKPFLTEFQGCINKCCMM